ncbi:MAG: hypothetical protein ABUK01_11205 [Leptospirales bacterium]
MNRWFSAIIIAVHLVGVGYISMSYNHKQINAICGDVLTDVSDNTKSESNPTGDNEDSIFSRMGIPVATDAGRNVEKEENRLLASFFEELDPSLNSNQFTFIKLKNDLIPPEYNPDILLLPS